MSNKEIMALSEKFLMNTYRRLPVALVKGKGSYSWDADGRRYLDFFSGLAVNNLGHGHPRVLQALSRQAQRLIHVSNLFHSEPQTRLAAMLVKHSFGDKVFFCNSGAEANEGAVKLARKYAKKHFGPGRFEVVTMTNSFHGRTLAMITATGQTKYQKGFEPLMPGFRYAEFGNLQSLKDALSEATCAVLVEPVQGEGGIRIPPQDYFKAVRSLCDERKVLLIMDEVQTGIGRTGRLFAHEHFGTQPDVMTLAKALASGLPIGAIVAKDFVAEAFEPGDHAATFGGNPLVTAVGQATLDTILKQGLTKAAALMGRYFLKGLESLRGGCRSILEVRGIGLMLAVDLDREARPVVLDALQKGLLVNAVGEKTLRILPPLNVRKKEIDASLKILKEVLTT